MAIGIDDLDDDDILEQSEPITQQQDTYVQEPNDYQQPNDDDDSFMLDFLRSKGIDDPSRIKFEDDNGQIIERNWNDLSRSEQLNILNTPLTSSSEDSNDLDDEEYELLNAIRNSGMTPSQYLQSLVNNNNSNEPVYQVDNLSDDELYVLDLESRVGELSDEDLAQALAIAKQNEELYKKQVEGIRKEYKEREDFLGQQEQAQLEEQQNQAFLEYQNKVVDAIDGFKSVGNLDLNFEDSDKEELAEFMLAQDQNGYNYLYRALQDPQTLVKAAWFILNGDEAINGVADYFTNQIKLVSENQYRKGYEDAKNGLQSKRPEVVISKTKTNPHRQYKTIEDLDDED